MKNAAIKQNLLHSVMGLATASLLALSSGVFAAGGATGGSAATGADSSATGQQQGSAATSQDSSMSGRQEQGISSSQDAETQNQGLTGTDASTETNDAGSIGSDDQETGIADTNASIYGQSDSSQRQELSALSEEEIQDRDVVNLEGEELGSVQEVVMDADGSINGIIVSVGGVLGMGASEIFANAEELEIEEDQLVWQTSLDQEALSERQEYQAAGTSNE